MDIPEKYIQQLKTYFWDNGFNQGEYELQKLAAFASLVVKKNEVINLISRKDIESIIENHIFISAYLSHFLPEKINHFIDIGTGGGFPGIPFGIIRHNTKGVLIDSIRKKIDSIKEFIDKLKLNNISAVNERVENPAFVNLYKNCFDLVISRATVPLELLITYSIPLTKEKSYLAAIKGGDLNDEIKKAELKYKSYIRKLTVFELGYKPTNIRNEKEKKLVLLELNK